MLLLPSHQHGSRLEQGIKQYPATNRQLCHPASTWRRAGVHAALQLGIRTRGRATGYRPAQSLLPACACCCSCCLHSPCRRMCAHTRQLCTAGRLVALTGQAVSWPAAVAASQNSVLLLTRQLCDLKGLDKCLQVREAHRHKTQTQSCRQMLQCRPTSRKDANALEGWLNNQGVAECSRVSMHSWFDTTVYRH